jgi:glutamate/tyrosine decarboxylase-like PLP-dependent enzyme
MQVETANGTMLDDALALMKEGFTQLPPFSPHVDEKKLRDVLTEVAERMQANFPYQHPLYAGQMQKPPHAVARLAYALAMWINPNNHSLDGGKVSSAMEKEAINHIAQMLGLQNPLGHLCGGGTMANLEALWIANKLRPDSMIVASDQAHYTHSRLCDLLKIPFKAIPSDDCGRMKLSDLTKVLQKGNVGTVVVTTGTTAIGSIDPLIDVLKLRSTYNFRVHVDAAYGGYFKLAQNLSSYAKEVFDAVNQADSVVIDPHKHGLQPYGCGCVLFKDPSVGVFYKHDSPYTYFSSDELHLGEISLECSRPGSAAVALWATHRLLPLVAGGDFALGLEKSREAALRLSARISADRRFVIPFEPELDIVVFGVKAPTASQSSRLARSLFEIAAGKGLHLATANLAKNLFASKWKDIVWDQEYLTCVRSCLMKPEHLDWLDNIWEILEATATQAL